MSFKEFIKNKQDDRKKQQKNIEKIKKKLVTLAELGAPLNRQQEVKLEHYRRVYETTMRQYEEEEDACIQKYKQDIENFTQRKLDLLEQSLQREVDIMEKFTKTNIIKP